MPKAIITLTCCLCSEGERLAADVPADWQIYGGIDVDGFCPRHAIIAVFKDAQCPGCVGGWGDCPLWDAFAYRDRRTLTEDDLAMIRCGVCPRRINGTLHGDARRGTIENLDLSEVAPAAAGEALARAIREYWERYTDGA